MWLKDSFEVSTAYDSNQINIQTQITLLQSGPFLRRVSERLQAETVPPPPIQSEFFSRIRTRLNLNPEDPTQQMKQGLESAAATFDARPVNGTRLIELSCDSTSPQIAAEFVNTMASEFLEETLRSRAQSSQKTNEWLGGQLEETHLQLQEAEQRLQDFIRRSGNVFAASETTLDDSKLKQLRDELSTVQAERIAKQAHYELVTKAPPENLPELLSSESISTYQSQITALRKEKAALETTLTPLHGKVQKVDAQLAALQASLATEVSGAVARVSGEFDAARRKEELLSAAYNTQLQRVSAAAGKSSEYNSSKREVETLRQTYQTLLLQANQTGLSSSVPVSPLRIVELALPPTNPYRPRPPLNIGFGLVLGLACSVGIIFVRERSDTSVRHPAIMRQLTNVPHLGVIPSADALKSASPRALLQRLRFTPQISPANGRVPGGLLEEGRSVIAEAFRLTLTSLIRQGANVDNKSIILITSPRPGEGKTTVTANLGVALAETGQRVLLIDADLHRPSLHRVFGVPNERGLMDILTEETPIHESSVEGTIVETDVPGLSLMVNRAMAANISRLLHSTRFRDLLEHLRNRFDVILLDTAPMLHFSDARLIAPLARGLILVIRAGSTDRESVMEAHERIQADGLKLLGTVFNDWSPTKAHREYNYAYGYSIESRK
jgi:capsular exopolysaccharide synthesis family protein